MGANPTGPHSWSNFDLNFLPVPIALDSSVNQISAWLNLACTESCTFHRTLEESFPEGINNSLWKLDADWKVALLKNSSTLFNKLSTMPYYTHVEELVLSVSLSATLVVSHLRLLSCFSEAQQKFEQHITLFFESTLQLSGFGEKCGNFRWQSSLPFQIQVLIHNCHLHFWVLLIQQLTISFRIASIIVPHSMRIV